MSDDPLNRHRSFAVRFSALRRWSVASFFDINWQWPEEDIKPLSVALRRKQVKFCPGAAGEVPPLLSLHFDGSVVPRDEDSSLVKGSLYSANSGDVVYSKIDVRNGAIAVVPDDILEAVVTSEYPVYEVLPDAALPAYVHLLFRTDYFQAALNSKISGHSGRKRINPSELEGVAVPLPAVDVQQRIVDVWNAAQSPVREAEADLRSLVAELDSELRSLCSPSLNRILRRAVMSSRFSELPRWDLGSLRARRYREAHPHFPLMGDFVVEATDMVGPWDEPEAIWDFYGVSNRVGVYLSFSKPGSEFTTPHKRVKEDWFFHNPTRANVGSLGRVPRVSERAITSPEYQVWRIEHGLVPSYVSLLLSTRLFRELIQIHRVGAVKQRLFVENLRQIPIPYLDEGRQLVLAQQREAILGRIEAAAPALDNAQKRVEALITGREALDDLVM